MLICSMWHNVTHYGCTRVHIPWLLQWRRHWDATELNNLVKTTILFLQWTYCILYRNSGFTECCRWVIVWLYISSCTHYNLCIQTVRIFRKCITCFRFRRWHALHTFIEAFQGQYKDGTDGTQDFRIVSALYLIFRTAALLAHLISNHGRGTCNHAYVWLGVCGVCMCCVHVCISVVIEQWL